MRDKELTGAVIFVALAVLDAYFLNEDRHMLRAREHSSPLKIRHFPR